MQFFSGTNKTAFLQVALILNILKYRKIADFIFSIHADFPIYAKIKFFSISLNIRMNDAEYLYGE